MTNEPESVAYDPIAHVYDRLWGQVSTDRYLDVVAGWLADVVAGGAAVLDVACGTGQMAAALSQLGYRVAGVDASPRMLEFARQRLPGAEFSLGNFARLPFVDGHFAAILCLFDSLNHVPPDQLRSVFAEFARVLGPGGLLVFDVNTEDGFRQRWRGQSVDERDALVCITRVRYQADRGVGDYRITVFEAANDDPCWTRIDVTLHEYLHSRDELLAGLAAAGFAEVDVFSSEIDLHVSRDPGRDFFRCVLERPAGPR